VLGRTKLKFIWKLEVAIFPKAISGPRKQPVASRESNPLRGGF